MSTPKHDRRYYPRLAASFPIELIETDGNVLTATVTNISLGGLQFNCAQHTAKRIAPGGKMTIPSHNPGIKTRFGLSFQDQPSAAVQATCEVEFVRRLAENEYHIGLAFKEIDERGLTALDRYVSELTAGG